MNSHVGIEVHKQIHPSRPAKWAECISALKGSISMAKIRFRRMKTLMILGCLLFVVPTAWTDEFKFEVPEIKTGSFETPPRLTNRIREELVNKLDRLGLLAKHSSHVKRLAVNIKTKATYPAFSNTEYYTSLESRIQVVDISKPEIIAKKRVLTFNTPLANDFSEEIHADEIIDFLKTIPR
jgi:hypothetical protein